MVEIRTNLIKIFNLLQVSFPKSLFSSEMYLFFFTSKALKAERTEKFVYFRKLMEMTRNKNFVVTLATKV